MSNTTKAQVLADSIAITAKATAEYERTPSAFESNLRSIERLLGMGDKVKAAIEKAFADHGNGSAFHFERKHIPEGALYAVKGEKDDEVLILYKSNAGTDSRFLRFATEEEITTKFNAIDEKFDNFLADKLGIYA